MRQKYLISLNVKKNELKIKEFAVIDKDLKKVASEMLRHDNYTLLGDESYESKTIEASISKGLTELIGTLRTHNIFPISPYAGKIAESVIKLYDASEDGSTELFFDDVDLVAVEETAPA